MVLLTISTACFGILSILLGWVWIRAEVRLVVERERLRRSQREVAAVRKFWMQKAGVPVENECEDWPELIGENSEK